MPDIILPNPTQPDIFSVGFDPNLNRQTYVPPTSPMVYDSIEGAVNPGTVASGGSLGVSTLQTSSTQKYVAPGDDIQAAIDVVSKSGGGKVYFKAGTYFPKMPIFLRSRVALIGDTETGSIIDFQNQNFGFNAIGNNIYTAGTIAVTTGGVTVTGSLTTWTTSMIGQSILLSGIWYPIADVPSTTSITLALPFADTTLGAGTSYTIANIITDINISSLTVQNSNVSGFLFQYANNFQLFQMTVINCTTGINLQTSSIITLSQTDTIACGTGVALSSCFYMEMDQDGVESCAVNGVTASSCSKIAMRDNFIVGNAGNGIGLTSCDTMAIVNNVTRNNTSRGIELISGNSNIQMASNNVANNGSDGIKLTASSNNCDILNNQLNSNGGFGWNIANANCNNNYAVQNHFISNSSGKYSDSGTGTVISEGNFVLPTTLQSSSKSFSTSQTTQKMGGFAGSFKPAKSGTVFMQIIGDVSQNTTLDGAVMQLRYGTLPAPAAGDASTGTALGPTVNMTQIGVGTETFPFTVGGIVTGLAIGTTLWIDLGLNANTGGTASAADCQITAFEI